MKIPILCYHNILQPPENARIKSQFIPPDLFKSQMHWLKKNGFSTIQCLKTAFSSKTPEKPVIITFDDGYRDNFLHAFPVLKQLGFSAVFFVTAGKIGKLCDWKKKRDDYCGELMNETELKTLADSGMEIHSHGFSHKHFTDLTEDELLFELNTSRDIITGITGQPCRYICYPAGKYNNPVIKLCQKSGYTAGFTTIYGNNTSHTPSFELRRIEVKPGDFMNIRFSYRISHAAE